MVLRWEGTALPNTLVRNAACGKGVPVGIVYAVQGGGDYRGWIFWPRQTLHSCT